MFMAYRPLDVFISVCKPIISLATFTSQLILKPMGINVKDTGKETIERDELLTILQMTSTDGVLEKEHANMVTRALRLDMLAARDVMVHRLDIQWLDIDLAGSELLTRINKIRHTRIPVCRGDVDDIVGIVYLVDVLRLVQTNEFKLDKIVRPFIAIPENLPIERIITTMRDEKTQILIVMDEYGGTSGLISLEDVVEEVFGEMEDGPESERQPVEVHASGRVSAKAELRLDELISRLGLDPQLDESTETLANMIVNGLERIPRPGDTIESSIGLMRVENMARRRITRVGIQLKPSLLGSGSEG
jgi:putative hemolysin